MTEAPTQGQAAPEGQATQGEGQEQPERSFTQADLNKIAASEKRDGTKAGRQAAITELLDKAREVNPDIESIDDVLAAYTEYQGIQEAVTTEADRANTKAERMEARAKAAEENYTNTLRTYALRDSLRDAGINPERLKGAMRLADMSALEVDGEGNVANIESVVEAVQTEAPEWFQTERQRVNAPQTTGTGVEVPAGEVTKESMGRAMLGWLTEPVTDEPRQWP